MSSTQSRSPSPKSPSHSPPPVEVAEKVDEETVKKRVPIRAPTRSPSPVPVRENRGSRSPTPGDEEGRDEVMSVHSDDETAKVGRRSRSPSPKRRSSRSPRRNDRRDRDRGSDRHREDRRRRDRSRSRDRGRSDRRRSSVSPKRSRRDDSKEKEKSPVPPKKVAPPKEKKEPVDLLRTRAGGAYIPPAKLKLMQDQIADKNSEQYQRMNWERLKKKVHGLVNKVNTDNLVSVVRELLQENVIRGKGLIARSIIQAQAFSPIFSNVYAALVAVINSKFPHVGELILRRLVVQFKRSFRRNDKGTTVTVSKFIAHLINQQVAHELLALEIMMLMLETPSDDSVEVAIAFLKECGAKLTEIAPRAIDAVFARLRAILYTAKDAGSDMDIRITYMIETVMTIRKDKFKAYPAVVEDLDLIDEDDQVSHTLTLEDAIDPENQLNVFKLDTDFEKNEAQYDEIRQEIIGDADDSESEEEEEGADDEGDDDDDKEPTASGGTTEIIDKTEQNLVAFRREVYLTIQSSLDYQEAAHKLLKMRVKKELEPELCHMLVDCCTQERTYSRFFGLLCERFARLRKEFQMTFEQVARDTYATVHRFEITKLRNISRLISHLLFTDAISWMVLSDIHLTEEDTTSSGRIYIKYIFQELCESMGLAKLYERIKDPTLQGAFAGLFPRDNPQNTRFAINFFTLIGLGGLTIDLREFLEKGQQKRKKVAELDSESSSSSSSDDSSSDSSDSSDSDSDGDSSSSSSSSSSSDSEAEKKKKKKKAMKKKAAEKENRRSGSKKRHSREAAVQVKEEMGSPSREVSPRRERRSEKNRERCDRQRERNQDRDHSPAVRNPDREREKSRSPRRKEHRRRSPRESSGERREKKRSRSPKKRHEKERSSRKDVAEDRGDRRRREEKVDRRRRSRS